MSIQKQVEFDGEHFWGGEDTGTGVQDWMISVEQMTASGCYFSSGNYQQLIAAGKCQLSTP